MWRWMFRFKVSLNHHLCNVFLQFHLHWQTCRSDPCNTNFCVIWITPQQGFLFAVQKYCCCSTQERERIPFLPFPSCWNPHEIIGAEVVKCVFSLQVIQIKLSRPVMYTLLHTEFFPFGQLIPITGSSIVRVNFSYLWFLSLGWETHSGQFFKCRIRYLQEGAHNWSLQGMYYSQQAHFKFEYVLNFLSIY